MSLSASGTVFVGVLVIRSRPSLERLVRGALTGRQCMIRATNAFRRTDLGVTSCDCSYVLLSVVLPSKGNLGLLRVLGRRRGHRDIVVVSTHSSVRSGILKLRRKTSSCLPGPFRLTRLGTHVGDILEQRHDSNSHSLQLKGLQVRPSDFQMFISSGRLRLLGGRCSVLFCFTGQPGRVVSGTMLTRTI